MATVACPWKQFAFYTAMGITTRRLLSIRTVFPVRGRKVWYDDQRQVHRQIERGDELVEVASSRTMRSDRCEIKERDPACRLCGSGSLQV
jgi:hypothetical protein